MKTIYKEITIMLSVFLLLNTGCSDFLDEDSRERIEAKDRGVFTPQEILTGVYGMFTGWPYAFSYLGITEIISDNSDKGSSPSDTGGDKDVLNTLTFTSSSGSINEMWSHWNHSIGRATQSIDYTENNDMSDPTLKKRLIGEAKFIRALNYFFLVRGWGAIPIQEKSLLHREPVDSVYRYIESDLLDAIGALLPRSEYSPGDMGRATRGAAQGLLAKVYLYQQKWAKADEYAQKVIDSKEYDLMDDYIDAFKSDVAYHNAKESLFEFQAKASDASIAHGVRQYSQTQGARGDTGWGWGFNVPSQNLVDAYNNAGDAIRRGATIISRHSKLYDGRVVGSTENERYNYKAYSSSAPGDDWNDRFVPYLRYAEILLIKAEAANEMGTKNDEALAALKKVRDRVELNEVKIKDKDALRKIIWNERRLELAMEHDRWFDLIRTGQAAEAMAADGKIFVKGKHELFPIPNEQLIQTPDMIQNPNW